MSVLGELASASGRNDEQLNIALAEKLAQSADKAAIDELIGTLAGGPTAIANDAIKTLYELGERRPELIAGHAGAFFSALKSKNNRLVWGAMSALDTIATLEAATIAARLPEILDAAERGSVIAKDKAVSILARPAAAGQTAISLPILLDMLQTAAANQLPSYAETTAAVVDETHRAALVAVITKRLPAVPQPAKRARLEKVLRKLSKAAS